MRIRTAALAALLLASTLPAPASAQLAETRSLTAAAVKAALAAAEAEAVKNGWAVSIAVVDTHGELLGFLRMDGASLPSIEVAQAKARTSARGRQPSKAYADRIAAGNLAVLAMEYMPLQGGVPITVEGVVVGGIGVSGVTSAQDEQVALAGSSAVRP